VKYTYDRKFICKYINAKVIKTDKVIAKNIMVQFLAPHGTYFGHKFIDKIHTKQLTLKKEERKNTQMQYSSIVLQETRRLHRMCLK